jgi:hypothetical protein
MTALVFTYTDWQAKLTVGIVDKLKAAAEACMTGKSTTFEQTRLYSRILDALKWVKIAANLGEAPCSELKAPSLRAAQ